MKPDHQQQQWLKEHLGAVLRYRETFEEVYDHVITGLKDKPAMVSFDQTVNNILKDDFGGYDKLADLEKASKKTAAKNSVKALLSHFAGYFKFPPLLYILVAAAATYYLIIWLQIFSWNLWEIFLLGILIQTVAAISGSSKIFGALKTKYTQTGQVFNHTLIRPSLYKGIVGRMISMPFYTFICLYIAGSLFGYSGSHLSANFISIGITLFMVMFTVYTLSLRKLYSEETNRIVRIILATGNL